MGGLSTLGLIHTLIAVVALVSGAVALLRYRQISFDDRAGRIYLATTLLSALTALGIFGHGTFGPPHVLALMTLGALALGTIAARSKLFGNASRYVQAVAFSSTFLFHLVPGITETSTRLPPGAPLIDSPDSPILQRIFLVLLLVFIAALFLQIRWLRRTAGQDAAPPRVDRAAA